MDEFTKHLVVCLITAYFVSDFVLKLEARQGKLKGLRLVLMQALIVAVLSYLLCGAWTLWLIPATVFVAYAVVHIIPFRRLKSNVASFIVEQTTSLVVIVAVAFAVAGWTAGVSLYWIELFGSDFAKGLVVIAGGIATIKVGGILIGMAIQPFLDQLEEQKNQLEEQTHQLENAVLVGTGAMRRGFATGGRVIGNLERALIFLFVLADQGAAIGFLVAAKSVFRFGELKEHENRMEAEYIIIGTLMSFGYGILVSYATTYFMNLV